MGGADSRISFGTVAVKQCATIQSEKKAAEVLPNYMHAFVCVCMVFTYSTLGINRYGYQTCARGQLNRENGISLSSFTPENLVSRDRFGRSISCQPLISHTEAESGAYSGQGIPPAFPGGVHPYRQPPSGQSRVYWVKHLPTNCIPHQESASARLVVFKVAYVMGAAYSGNTMDQILRAPLFSYPLI